MKVGLVGKGIAHSLSPGMHMAEGRALGLEYQYDRFDVENMPYAQMPLAEIVSQAEAAGYAGLNITHPFKQSILAELDDLSDVAKQLGAVNTVVFQDGSRLGYNTDYTGFRSMLDTSTHVTSAHKTVLLGAGGAGRAVALALLDQGTTHLIVYDTHMTSARQLASLLQAARPQVQVMAIQNLHDIAFDDLDMVVNATPLGMAASDAMAIDPGCLSPRTCVVDIVYFPLLTPLLRAATKHGCPTISGAGMAVHQAAASFELFTGQPADIVRMSEVFNKLASDPDPFPEAK